MPQHYRGMAMPRVVYSWLRALFNTPRQRIHTLKTRETADTLNLQMSIRAPSMSKRELR